MQLVRAASTVERISSGDAPISTSKIRTDPSTQLSAARSAARLAGVALLASAAIRLSTGETLGFAELILSSALMAVIIFVVARWELGRAAESVSRTPLDVAPGIATQPVDDPTTGTLNRHGITIKVLENLALAERYARTFSVALVSLDHWKNVGAEYGRDAETLVLRTVADTLREALRMPDQVGRYDEDEFLVVMPETKTDGANQIAERIRHGVSDSEVPVNPRVKLHVTISAGLTQYRMGDDLQELLSRAGDAMLEAKQQGSNRVIVKLAA